MLGIITKHLHPTLLYIGVKQKSYLTDQSDILISDI